jgi:hypothetical protein
MRGQRTIGALLAVVAALLGLDVIVRGRGPATGQEADTAGPGSVLLNGVVTNGGPYSAFQVYRFWSDGTVDVRRCPTIT